MIATSVNAKEEREIRRWIRTYVVPHRTKSVGVNALSAYGLKHIAAKLIGGLTDHYTSEEEFIELLKSEGVKVSRNGGVAITRTAGRYLEGTYLGYAI